MPHEQLLMGSAVALASAAGLWHRRWLLAETRKGQGLARWLGARRALWCVTALLAGGVLLGLLLAGGLVRPLGT